MPYLPVVFWWQLLDSSQTVPGQWEQGKDSSTEENGSTYFYLNSFILLKEATVLLVLWAIIKHTNHLMPTIPAGYFLHHISPTPFRDLKLHLVNWVCHNGERGNHPASPASRQNKCKETPPTGTCGPFHSIA